MKLQSISDGRVYVTRGRTVMAGTPDGEFDRVGRLPLPAAVRDRIRYFALTSPRFRSLSDRLVGRVTTVNLWAFSRSDLLATVGPQVFVSGDGGRRWEPTLRLPESSGMMGVLPSSVAHYEGTTYLGEYPLDSGADPRVRVSRNAGRTWKTVTALPEVRHVHAIQRDPYSGDWWVTTGDTDRESKIGRLRNGEFVPVGGGSQQWRAVELAFTPSWILWGMDCPYADSVHIFKLPRTEIGAADPTPVPVHQVADSVYYSASLSVGGERWVAFSTAMEAGHDTTGPTDQNKSAGNGAVLVSSSTSGYTEWHEIASFRRRPVLADRLPGWLPRAGGYVFLEAEPEMGLLFNPFNTASDDGTIRRLPVERFSQQTWPTP